MKQKSNTNSMNFKLSLVSQPISVPVCFDVKGSGKWVKWGTDNLFPQFLWENYLKNSNLQSIINSMLDYVVGDGIICGSFTNKDGDTFQDVIKKSIVDYLIFGCFSIEIIRNREGGIAELYYQNVMNVRLSEDEKTAYLSNKWGSWRSDIIELPTDKDENHFLFYCTNGINRGIYGIPSYIGALKSVLILNATRDFHLNNLNNNFAGNAIINFNNGVPSSDVQEEIEEKIKDKFSGSENAGKFLLAFNDNKDSAVTIERLEADNFGDLYSSLQDSSTKDIFTAFRIAPILVGVNPENNGFSKTEYLEAFTLYNRTVIKPIQDKLISLFKKIEQTISFIPFKLEGENE